MQDTSYRHLVGIHPAPDALVLECRWCGPLGVAITDEAADAVKAIRESFGAVLADLREEQR